MNRVAITFFSLTGLIVLFVFGVAFVIEVDYSDTYHLLSNAKTIAFGQGPYDYHRFLMSAVLQAPVFLIDSFAWRVPHLLGAVSFLGLLLAAYFLFRRFLTGNGILLAVFLLSSTPLLLHYAPSAKDDVMALAFFVGTVAFYFHDRVWLAGAAAAFAVGCRYNLGPTLFALLAVLEWRRRRVVPLFLFPAALFLLFPLIIYPWIGRSSIFEAIPLFFRELLWAYRENKLVGYQSSLVGLVLLKRLAGMHLLAMGFLGAVVGWQKRRRADLPFAVWGILSLLVQIYLVPGKEGRYFFVCLLPIVYFAVRGFEECWSSRRGWGYLVCALFFLVGGYRAVGEIEKFFDPFYRRPFARDVSATAVSWAKESGGKIVWVGDYYGTYPSDWFFASDDDYAYIYHLHKHVVQFYTGLAIGHLKGGEIVRGKRWEDGVALPGADAMVEKGDVLIINPEKIPIVTKTVGKEEHPPLLLQRVGEKTKNMIRFDRVEVF